MVEAGHATARVPGWLSQGQILFLLITLLGLALFFYIVARRMTLLLGGERDPRFDRPWTRLARVLQFWLGQWKQPRFAFSGVLHIAIFAGFLVLSVRSISLVMVGISGHFVMTGFSWHLYHIVKDYAATLVFVAVILAAIRRAIFKPSRYAVPVQ